jgi:replicative superfamily II helicase
LVYCAPTSGGKSLVAEVLMLRRILTTNRPAMLVLPFVSICSEKSEHLRCEGWCWGGEIGDTEPGGRRAAGTGLVPSCYLMSAP